MYIMLALALLLALLLVLVFFIFFYKNNAFGYMYKNKRLNFIDYWDDPWENNSDTKYFEKLSESPALKKFKTINFYSVFGRSPVFKNKDEFNIQFSGESTFRNPNKFDLNLIPGTHNFIEKKNIVDCPPFMHLIVNSIYQKNVDDSSFFRHISQAQVLQKKFCLFSVSNGEAKERINFFKKLSNYRSVDSCGKIENNKKNCPGRDKYTSKENCTFISGYKFMICFENCSVYNYCTEKILNAYMCGTIPIYWGCPNIEEFINMDAIFYLTPGYTVEEEARLIKAIVDCDQNMELYLEKYNLPLFKNNQIPEKLKFSRIFD